MLSSGLRLAYKTRSIRGYRCIDSVYALAARRFSTTKPRRVVEPSFSDEAQREAAPNETTILDAKARLALHQQIFVGNLAWDATRRELTETFSQFGEIVSIRPNHGYAHIKYTTLEEATRAVETHLESPISIGGRVLFLQLLPGVTPFPRLATQPPSNRLCILKYNGHWRFFEDAIQSHRENLVRVRMPIHWQSGRVTGTGILQFRTVAQATDAMRDLEGKVLNGEPPLRVVYAPPATPLEHIKLPSAKLHVYGFVGGEKTVRAFFAAFANHIIDYRIIVATWPLDGPPKGAAIVEFDSVQMATKALDELNGAKTVSGHELKLSYGTTILKVEPREPQSNLYIGHYYGTKDTLMEAFASYASSISNISLRSYGDPARGARGFIYFVSQADATTALKSLHKTADKDGNLLRLNYGHRLNKTEQKYPPNVTLHTASSDTIDVVREVFGSVIKEIRVKTEPDLMAFIVFKSVEDAVKAVNQLDGTQDKNGIPLALSYSSGNGPEGRAWPKLEAVLPADKIMMQLTRPERYVGSPSSYHIRAPSSKLHVRNFPLTERHLRRSLKEFASSIFRVRVVRNMGFVDFVSVESATEALLKLNCVMTTDGVMLDMVYSTSNHSDEPTPVVFAWGLTGTKDTVLEAFQKYAGSIVNIRLERRPPSVFIEFKSPQTAEDAIQTLNHTQTPDGQALHLRLVHHRRGPILPQTMAPQSVAFSLSFQNKREALAALGNFKESVRYIRHLPSPSGYATFFHFRSVSDATSAIKRLDGTFTAEGKRMRLMYAREQLPTRPRFYDEDGLLVVDGSHLNSPSDVLSFENFNGEQVSNVLLPYAALIRGDKLSSNGEGAISGTIRFDSVESATKVREAALENEGLNLVFAAPWVQPPVL